MAFLSSTLTLPFAFQYYRVAKYIGCLTENGKWARWAGLASAAHLAHCSISCEISYVPTRYRDEQRLGFRFWESAVLH